MFEILEQETVSKEKIVTTLKKVLYFSTFKERRKMHYENDIQIYCFVNGIDANYL